ncbi:hypothetical protein BC937DRAFT_91067 [Endogone sp. FLAS-F59071]|nr:hypothetical protein BC937DRAFT_91067 [Endogone sp. FLAS-F59071]|eukprot:RUS16567.1 hypothetical protein BC937DRAFT_91067 [Endogone sp. FLAS-F59071]
MSTRIRSSHWETSGHPGTLLGKVGREGDAVHGSGEIRGQEGVNKDGTVRTLERGGLPSAGDLDLGLEDLDRGEATAGAVPGIDFDANTLSRDGLSDHKILVLNRGVVGERAVGSAILYSVGQRINVGQVVERVVGKSEDTKRLGAAALEGRGRNDGVLEVDLPPTGNVVFEQPLRAIGASSEVGIGSGRADDGGGIVEARGRSAVAAGEIYWLTRWCILKRAVGCPIKRAAKQDGMLLWVIGDSIDGSVESLPRHARPVSVFPDGDRAAKGGKAVKELGRVDDGPLERAASVDRVGRLVAVERQDGSVETCEQSRDLMGLRVVVSDIGGWERVYGGKVASNIDIDSGPCGIRGARQGTDCVDDAIWVCCGNEFKRAVGL